MFAIPLRVELHIYVVLLAEIYLYLSFMSCICFLHFCDFKIIVAQLAFDCGTWLGRTLIQIDCGESVALYTYGCDFEPLLTCV
ncbi:hypothetical protein BDW66DRAFT_133931 [Aspergillus desertorum]